MVDFLQNFVHNIYVQMFFFFLCLGLIVGWGIGLLRGK